MVNLERKQRRAAILILIGVAVSALGRNSRWVMSDYSAWQHLAKVTEATMLLFLGIALQLHLRYRWTAIIGEWLLVQGVVNLICRMFDVRGRFSPFEYLVSIGLVIFYRSVWRKDRKNETP